MNNRKTLSDIHKKNISDSLKGESHSMFGKKFSEEHRKKLSDAKKGKPSPNKGKIASEETKQKQSLAHKGKTSHKKGKTYEELYGKERAAELLKKNSDGQKGKVNSEESNTKRSETLIEFYKHNTVSEENREKISKRTKGRIASEETKLKMSIARKGKPSWNANTSKFPFPDYNLEKHCKCGCDSRIQISKHHRYNKIPDYCPGHQARIIQLRVFKDTKIEVSLQNALLIENIKFEKHKAIHGIPDIFIEPNICIFADGDYWHANPNMYTDKIYIRGKIATDIRNKDKKVNDTLTKDGYKILRFWEYEINNNLSSCINLIKKEIKCII